MTTTLPQIDARDLQAGQSVSHGTLRPDHLADSLLGEIGRLGLDVAVPAELAKQAQQLASGASNLVASELPEFAEETVGELLDFINEAAPDGWALQALDGDGSDLCWQPITLRARLQAVGSRWADTDNPAMVDLIDRFNDEPDCLQDFDRSDWVNLCECYTRDLLHRWEHQRRELWELFESYCEAIGATSTLEALEGETIEDPDDMAAAIVNRAMSFAALELLHEIKPER